jgi:hypothetical protein
MITVLQQDAQLVFYILWVHMHKVQLHDIYFYFVGHHSENYYNFYTTWLSHGA